MNCAENFVLRVFVIWLCITGRGSQAAGTPAHPPAIFPTPQQGCHGPGVVSLYSLQDPLNSALHLHHPGG